MPAVTSWPPPSGRRTATKRSPVTPKQRYGPAKPCVEVRGLGGATLDRRIKLGGMNDFHAAAKGANARAINY
jgi:hypothetical protein